MDIEIQNGAQMAQAWQAYLQQVKEPINNALKEILSSLPEHDASLQRIKEAMKYAVLDAGKRIRPAILLATYQMFENDYDYVVEAACALELVHCYSLVHDDLPLMDNDVIRRGKPTVHVRFDPATAILAGDAMLTMAFELLSPYQECNALIQTMAQSAGIVGMVGGQAMDMHFENTEPQQNQIIEMYERKTGALISAACKLGGLLAGVSKKNIELLDHFGRHVGVLFQIADDILGVSGDPKKTGKPVGRDNEKGKATLMSMIDESTMRNLALQCFDNALFCLQELDVQHELLKNMAAFAWYRQF